MNTEDILAHLTATNPQLKLVCGSVAFKEKRDSDEFKGGEFKGDDWLECPAEQLLTLLSALKNDVNLSFDFLRLLSAVDYKDHFQVVYHLYSLTHNHNITLKVKLDRLSPHLPSASALWPAADWHEREAFDMMGIVFDGHPDLSRILLPLDWEGFPLRKDYESPKSYHGVSND